MKNKEELIVMDESVEIVEDNNGNEPEHKMQDKEMLNGFVNNNCSEFLNGRKGPDKNFEVLFLIERGSKLKFETILDNEDWYKIKMKDGREGYSMAVYITEER